MAKRQHKRKISELYSSGDEDSEGSLADFIVDTDDEEAFEEVCETNEKAAAAFSATRPRRTIRPPQRYMDENATKMMLDDISPEDLEYILDDNQSSSTGSQTDTKCRHTNDDDDDDDDDYIPESDSGDDDEYEESDDNECWDDRRRRAFLAAPAEPTATAPAAPAAPAEQSKPSNTGGKQ